MDEQERAILEFLLAHEDTVVHYATRPVDAARELTATRPGARAATGAQPGRLTATTAALDTLAGNGLIGLRWAEGTMRITDRGRRALERSR